MSCITSVDAIKLIELIGQLSRDVMPGRLSVKQ